MHSLREINAIVPLISIYRASPYRAPLSTGKILFPKIFLISIHWIIAQCTQSKRATQHHIHTKSTWHRLLRKCNEIKLLHAMWYTRTLGHTVTKDCTESTKSVAALPTLLNTLVSQVYHNWSFFRFLLQLLSNLISNFV
jgi:hypothetical protein